MQASILRQIVAGPRIRHPEAGLDLCYVADNLIATSGPSSNYPQRAYRNPLDDLVNFLDSKHGKDWCIWEFRAEGTGYPDSEVYGRIHHYPWPDHHPPPFALIPAIMGSMRNWLQGLDDTDAEGNVQTDKEKRVAVVHCKAGKGRSGTIACSYLITHEGWKVKDALQRFTERRMRVGFGPGVSIPSQLRWVGYVDQWANQLGKKYVERPVEILELHVWGLRDGVKVAVEGYVDEGKKIKCFHLFHRSERTIVDDGKTVFPEKRSGTNSESSSRTGTITEAPPAAPPSSTWPRAADPVSSTKPTVTAPLASSPEGSAASPTKCISAVILRPSKPVILPSSDVNIDFERRGKAAYTGWAMVTSIAHVWFNAYFEGGDKHDSGVFEIEWEAMDGIKGTSKRGVKALDRLKVVWRFPPPSRAVAHESGADSISATAGKTITEPEPGEPISESHPADWRCQDSEDEQDRPLRDQENLPTQDTETETHAPEIKGLTSASEHPLLTGVSTAAASALSATAQSIHGLGKDLGMRKQADESKDVSLAGSDVESSERPKPSDTEAQRGHTGKTDENEDDFKGVQSYFVNGDNNPGQSS
ncbi:putative phosphatidylinositol-3,4,5-trisphosphate 3-phosphatase [Aspergillus clavatus NRRL 1]|uniref:phosphatidylinositol-3,4,5-trisphosphate 3-phosphatase n=1 Tax=Aspergillus clavatus (strain ATCC 1007 / CBS 513.65 / DSM 816 / NCTC 3887 / NRRL 1 / QM 1276 / 107) TaxID=344612 RepID=A1C6N4_ASPCL|nr:dual specificity phosphatase, catalytic domain protein [Aspergillus clavatus NRRL 1]EAW14055.1 dual specificity phosphatase, catalytic domain protein [Aspergillus clavatus NRRL 1]